MEEEILEFDEVTKDCVHALLDHFWITRERNFQVYMKIREREAILKRFFEDHFRLRLHVNKHLAKLEKTPVDLEPWMGITEFQERRDYALFCCLMAFLESKHPGDQFLLSTLCEEMALYMLELKSDALNWTEQSDRRSFARTLKFAESMQIIAVNEGNVLEFSTNPDQEALFTVVAHSHYFLRRTAQPLITYSNFKDIAADENELSAYHRLFRHLFFSPAVHIWEMSEGEKFWIENNRVALTKMIRGTTYMDLETYKEAVVLTGTTQSEGFFPNAKAISLVVLHFAAMVHGRVLDLEEAQPSEHGVIVISRSKFDEWLQMTRVFYGSGWSKMFQDMDISTLSRGVLNYLQEWKMADASDTEVRLYATLIRMVGQYPDDYQFERNGVV